MAEAPEPDSLAELTRRLAELERENRALDEQVKLLVKTEQRLYRSRLELDHQLTRTQVLEQFALECASGLEPAEILARGVRALDRLFSFEWCVALQGEGHAMHVVAAAHPSAAREGPFDLSALRERWADATGVTALRMPGEIDPAALGALWPATAAPPTASRESLLVAMRIAERSAPAPVWLLAYSRTRGALRINPADGRIEGGGGYLYLFATHLERALESAWLNAALRQRTEELARSLAELEHTQARLAESAKMEAIGRLAGGVAHDFNNLLTVIGGHAALMAAGLPPGDAAHTHAAKVAVAVEKAASITAQLLAFGRRQIQTRVAIDLNALVTATTQMLGRLLGEHVELQLHLEASLPLVAADRVQMDQVLLNLLVNARDALPDGGTVRVTTRAAGARDLARANEPPPPGEYVLLEVSDDGLGMDDTTRARIFEPFYSTKGPGHGSGLGLAVVYGIVRQSEGLLFVESAPGKGATFGVLLPVSRTSAPAPPVARETSVGRPGAHVLLVEDEPTIREIARRFLQQAGYRVTEAVHGRDALAMFDRGGGFDLLLTDVVMPVMGGLALARELRRRDPGLRVLYMSGYSQELADLGRHEGGPEHFLAKPFTAAALNAAVAAALALRTGPPATG